MQKKTGLLLAGVSCLGLIGALLGLCVWSGWPPALFKVEPLKASGPVARVGGSAIPRWMFDNAFKDRLATERKQGRRLSENEIARIRAEIETNLVNMELLSQAARRQGVKISPAAGELRLRVVEGSFKNSAAFDEALRLAGLDRRRYRELWQQQALVNRFVELHIKPGVKVSEAEIRALYASERARFRQPEQVRASHILLALKDGADRDAVRQQAEGLRLELKRGADFGALAREHSACPSAAKGGDLGWFGREDMARPFAAAAFALKPGQLSAVVETEHGLHLILKTGARPARLPDYAELRPELERILVDAATRAALDEYLVGLRRQVPVDICSKGGCG